MTKEKEEWFAKRERGEKEKEGREKAIISVTAEKTVINEQIKSKVLDTEREREGRTGVIVRRSSNAQKGTYPF